MYTLTLCLDKLTLKKNIFLSGANFWTKEISTRIIIVDIFSIFVIKRQGYSNVIKFVYNLTNACSNISKLIFFLISHLGFLINDIYLKWVMGKFELVRWCETLLWNNIEAKSWMIYKESSFLLCVSTNVYPISPYFTDILQILMQSTAMHPIIRILTRRTSFFHCTYLFRENQE